MITVNDDVVLVSSAVMQKGDLIGWTPRIAAAYALVLAQGLWARTGGNAPGTVPGPDILHPSQFQNNHLMTQLAATDLYTIGVPKLAAIAAIFASFPYSQIIDPIPHFPETITTQLTWSWVTLRKIDTSTNAILMQSIPFTSPGFANTVPIALPGIVVHTVVATDDLSPPSGVTTNQTGDRSLLPPGANQPANCFRMISLAGTVSRVNGVSPLSAPRGETLNIFGLFRSP